MQLPCPILFRLIHFAAVLLLALSSPGGARTADGALTVTRLRTEGVVDPMGIDVPAPRLRWQIESSARGVLQTAYQVQVARSSAALAAGKPEIWESGRVASHDSIHVAYAGPALTSRERCAWHVRVWDNQGRVSPWSAPAMWEMGLLAPKDRVAHWIGYPTIASDYTLETRFLLRKGAVGVFFRTQDPLAESGYMWQISGNTAPVLRRHRRANGGYTLLGDSIPLTNALPAGVLDGKPHTLTIALRGATIRTSVDGKLVDTTEDGTFTGGGIGLREAPEESADFLSVRVTGANGRKLLDAHPASVAANPFNGGILSPSGLTITGGDVVLSKPPPELTATGPTALPLLRRAFTLARPIRSARLYASALGLYELHLNGRRIGNDRFAPAWTDYHKRIQYRTYDVTGLLKPGGNVIGALLGPGWYAGHLAWFPANEYGSRVALWAQLEVTYADGSRATIPTDARWTVKPGPIVSSDIITGETYNARSEQPGWDKPNFAGTGWKAAGLIDADAKGTLVAAVGPQVEVTGTLKPINLTQPKPGIYVYDIGQEIAGGIRIHLRGKPGKTIHLRYAEWLQPDGTGWTANLSHSDVPDSVTLGPSGALDWEPQFTYHGFRYIQIEDASQPPKLADLTALAMGTAMDRTMSFETSSPLLNQLHRNLVWTGRNDSFSIPTDACARSERLGWTGDAQFFLPTATYALDSQAFYEKWMTDLADAQKPDGGFTNVAPASYFGGSYGGGWGDVGVILPYVLWQRFDDTRVVADHYAAMQRWIIDVQGKSKNLTVPGSWAAPGDWLNAGESTPPDLIATAYFAYDTHLLAEMARALGKTADADGYDDLFAKIRVAFQAKFVAADGTVGSGSQTSYALAISMDLITAEQRAAAGQRLADDIRARGGHIGAGFVGAPALLTALADAGQADAAFALLTQTTYPSWGYMVGRGATTVWESWDVIQPDGTFKKAANSFNHVVYGSFGDWMYRAVGGIAPDPSAPGFKRIVIRPWTGRGLTHANSRYDTAFGPIAVRWARTAAAYRLAADIPPNTTATVYVPTTSAATVTETGRPASNAPGARFDRLENGSAVYTVGSGHYRFTAPAATALPHREASTEQPEQAQ
jgi:alpha-L-rhamnosidase